MDGSKEKQDQYLREAGKSSVFLRIRDERARQLGLGYTADHDDDHNTGAISRAAAAFALRDPTIWPWGRKSFSASPDDRIGDLIKAGALIVAEIERLERVKPEHFCVGRVVTFKRYRDDDCRTYVIRESVTDSSDPYKEPCVRMTLIGADPEGFGIVMPVWVLEGLLEQKAVGIDNRVRV